MVDLIKNNYDWIFSGAGVFLISILVGYLFKKRKNKISQQQSSGHHSKNFQIGGNYTENQRESTSNYLHKFNKTSTNNHVGHNQILSDNVVLNETTISITGKSLLQEIYGDALKPSISRLGLSLGLTLDLFPALFFKLKSPIVKQVFKRHIDELSRRFEHFNDSDIVSVPPELGVEILEKLSYVTDEDIASFYINLLEKASHKSTANSAHPRFLSFIAGMSPDEARILQLFKHIKNIPWVKLDQEIDVEKKGHETFSSTVYTTLLDKQNYYKNFKINGQYNVKLDLTYPDNINQYWDNLVSIGILRIARDDHQIVNKYYELIFQDDIKKVKEMNETNNEQWFYWKLQAGSFEISENGHKFIELCVKQIGDKSNRANAIGDVH